MTEAEVRPGACAATESTAAANTIAAIPKSCFGFILRSRGQLACSCRTIDLARQEKWKKLARHIDRKMMQVNCKRSLFAEDEDPISSSEAITEAPKARLQLLAPLRQPAQSLAPELPPASSGSSR